MQIGYLMGQGKINGSRQGAKKRLKIISFFAHFVPFCGQTINRKAEKKLQVSS